MEQGATQGTDAAEADYMPGFYALQIWRATMEAKEAEHRAAFEPERQRLALLERKTKLVMSVLATLFAMAYLVGALLLAPWILPPTGLAAAVAYRWR